MTLATSDPEQIESMLSRMLKNRDAIEMDINNLVYHMNGGLDYDDAWLLTYDQRKSIFDMLQRILNPKKSESL